MTGTIRFVGSPYPDGHAIRVFKWYAALYPNESVSFQLHLETEPYNKSKAVSTNSSVDWTSPVVWNNYRACTISSIKWDQQGFRVADSIEALEKLHLDGKTFRVDSNPAAVAKMEDDEFAFGIYLLGHDSCADHTITFHKNPNESFDIDWTGKIALSYSGQNEFDYEFEAHILNAIFDGIVEVEGEGSETTDR